MLVKALRWFLPRDEPLAELLYHEAGYFERNALIALCRYRLAGKFGD